MTASHLVRPIVCYITDRNSLGNPGELLPVVRRAIAAGVDWIQIREKDLPARELLALVSEAVKAASGSATKILVNDRLDIAIAAGAAGVHLAETSLPVGAVNTWRGRGIYVDGKARSAGFLIGASCHSVESARAAERDGADYVVFGPVFATPSKAAFGAPQGINRLAEVSASVKIPVLAIGGVNLENVRGCFAAGAAGVAAIRMFQETSDLGELVARLRQG
jgi:thiamine-phosphate pyrophosphorylase